MQLDAQELLSSNRALSLTFSTEAFRPCYWCQRRPQRGRRTLLIINKLQISESVPEGICPRDTQILCLHPQPLANREGGKRSILVSTSVCAVIQALFAF
jgi:hypothetical protein